jgi:hypothetical protein
MVNQAVRPVESRARIHACVPKWLGDRLKNVLSIGSTPIAHSIRMVIMV